MASQLFETLKAEISLLEKAYLGFAVRPAGNYTRRQLSAGAAYTVFCHAEFETYFESWATEFVDVALARWNAGAVSRPLLHLCSFHEGRGELSGVPQNDIWSDLIVRSIRKQQDVIGKNHGIKEANVCRMLAPIGFDVRNIDPLLWADLSAFSSMRGSHAHQSHTSQLSTIQDPFDRRLKVGALLTLIEILDGDLVAYLTRA